MIRKEFTAMLEDVGCPVCGSLETYESHVSINDRDEVPACVCDECGHVEEMEEQ